MIMTRLGWWMVVPVMFGCLACATAEKPKPAEHPWMMVEDTKLFLNPFTLEQAGFPLYGKKMEPLSSSLALPPEAEAQAVIQQRFEQAGFHPAAKLGLDLGRLHIEADGYDSKARVGWLYLTDDDFELPVDPELQGKAVLGFFQTKRSPKRVSMLELIMLQQICANGQISLALIHARQFAYPNPVMPSPEPALPSPEMAPPQAQEALPSTKDATANADAVKAPTVADAGVSSVSPSIPSTSVKTKESSLNELGARVDFFLQWFKESQRRRSETPAP